MSKCDNCGMEIEGFNPIPSSAGVYCSYTCEKAKHPENYVDPEAGPYDLYADGSAYGHYCDDLDDLGQQESFEDAMGEMGDY